LLVFNTSDSKTLAAYVEMTGDTVRCAVVLVEIALSLAVLVLQLVQVTFFHHD